MSGLVGVLTQRLDALEVRRDKTHALKQGLMHKLLTDGSDWSSQRLCRPRTTEWNEYAPTCLYP